MATLMVIREYNDVAQDRVGRSSVVILGQNVTDSLGLSIKTITATNVAADAAQLTARTHWVQIENKGALTVRYAVRPKNIYVTVPATALHVPVLAGSLAVEAVYPGAYISFVEAA